jgi:uncharacterized delta-60 repeat protein
MVDTTKPNTAPTFMARTGKLTTTFDTGSTDKPYYIALQQDGKILLGGTSDGKFALARYNVDGTLDTTFSGDGKLTTQLGNEPLTTFIAPQPDGKIVVGMSTVGVFTLARLLPNGDLDPTFGVNGKITSVYHAGYMMDLTILDSGKILTAGTNYDVQTDFLITQYNPDGTLDTGFGNNGSATINVGVSDFQPKMLVQSNGKILFSGIDTLGSSNMSYSLVRLNANGTLDTSFSGDGKLPLTNDAGHLNQPEALAVQADGKILVGGSMYALGMALLRYNADGSVDATFNGTGTATVHAAANVPTTVRAISVQKDGKILAVGDSPGNDQANHIVVARFLSDGSLDETFGKSGLADATIPSGTSAANVHATDLLIQPDGKIIVYGDIGNGGGDFVLVRYDANGSLDTTFAPLGNTLDGTPVFSEPYSVYSLSAVVLDSDVMIVDAELAAGGSYNGASLTLMRHGGANAEDVFLAKFGGTLSALTAGSYFSVDNVTVGSVTANSGGTLSLTFAKTATQALVNKAMQQIAYENLSDAPPGKVQIDWTFSDSNTGTQGTGGTLNASGSTTVTITGTNDFPLFVKPLLDQKIAPAVAFTFAIPGDTFSDPDHDALSYSVLMSDGTALPPWLSFDPATRTLSGTPEVSGGQTLTLRVFAKDAGGLNASTTFALKVDASTNHLDGTAGADNLVGTAANDIIQGFAGNDTLDGKAGADMLIGGDGNDTYYVDNAGDTVSETASGGTDTVYTTISYYQLAANVEYARALSGGQADLTGNELGNVLYAGSGNNVLDGGLGNDTASYAYATTGVTVSLSTTQAQDTEGSGVDTLRNIENLAGSRFDDNLLGNQDNNTLNGSMGADFMVGGNGSDIYIVDNVGDVVRETNADPVKGGIDIVNASVSFTLGANVENLTLTGTSPIDGTGNALANKLVGNSGNNILDGGAGADVMSGGLGNDTYYVDNSGDVVAEVAAGGTDTVISTVTRTLGDNQENLTLAGTAAINGAGNSLDNTITGNSARNVLTGGAGADKMYGGLGDDFYYVDNAGDTVVESSDATLGGTDTVNSTVSYTLGNYVENLTLSGATAINGAGNALANKIVGNGAANVLSGGDGADTLVGGLGSDTLVGGNGKDVLEGGSGSDVFVFNVPSETGTTSAAWDVVNDFVRGQDKIDLRGIDANTATVANDAFTTFIAGTAAFTAAGQLKFLNGVLYGNTDGDAYAEFAIQLTGVTQLTTADVAL